MNRAQKLFRSSIIVILLLGFGKLLGLWRLQLISNVFGTSPQFDAFTAANQLPELFSTILASNALAAAFIPVYSAYILKREPQEAERLASTVITLLFTVLGIVAAIAAIFAPWLTAVVLVPDFPPDVQRLTAELMRIILLQTIFFGISNGVLSSMLNAHQHFALPALAPVALDIGYLIGLYLLVPRLGIHGLAWGTVISGILHIVIQLPALLKLKLRLRLQLDLKLAGIREMLTLMGPRIVTLGAIQLADLFIIRFASGLPSGSTSGYFYGYALMQLPETLLGTAVAIVMFPTMAELFNAGNVEGMKQTAVKALGIIWTLTIPAAIGMVLLSRPVLVAFLEGGAFDSNSTQLVYSVLVVFSFRIVSEATVEIVARLLYAQHDTKSPMFVYIGWFLVNLSTAYLFVFLFDWGVVGLAAASTVAFTFLAIMLFWLNSRRLGGLAERQLGIIGGRAILAGGGMALVIFVIGQFIVSPFIFLVVAIAGGGTTYLLLNVLLGGQELQEAWQLIRQKAH